MRKVRSTFLLRLVVFAGSIGLFILVLSLSLSLPKHFTMGTIIFLIMFWGLGVEAGLLPYLIEHILVEKAKRSGKQVDSIWFVDVDRKKETEK